MRNHPVVTMLAVLYVTMLAATGADPRQALVGTLYFAAHVLGFLPAALLFRQRVLGRVLPVNA